MASTEREPISFTWPNWLIPKEQASRLLLSSNPPKFLLGPEWIESVSQTTLQNPNFSPDDIVRDWFSQSKIDPKDNEDGPGETAIRIIGLFHLVDPQKIKQEELLSLVVNAAQSTSPRGQLKRAETLIQMVEQGTISPEKEEEFQENRHYMFGSALASILELPEGKIITDDIIKTAYWLLCHYPTKCSAPKKALFEYGVTRVGRMTMSDCIRDRFCNKEEYFFH